MSTAGELSNLNEDELRLANIVDVVFRENRDYERALQELLCRLNEAVQGPAAILWKSSSDQEVLWHFSVGIDLGDADRNSPFTCDVVANVHAAFQGNNSDIYELTSNVDANREISIEDKIRYLVVNCRQLVIPVSGIDGTVAVLVLFQPAGQPTWSFEQLEVVRTRVDSWLMGILDTSIDASSVGSSDLVPAVIEKNELAVPDTQLAEVNEGQVGNEIYVLRHGEVDAYKAVREQVRNQQRAIQLFEVVGRSLDVRECAFDVANEVFALLGTGRVSLAIFRGSSCKIRAISNQQVFDTRSEVVRMVEKLATKCARTRRAIWHPEEHETLPSNITRIFAKYYEVADSQSIALIPLIRNVEPSSDPNDLKAIVKDRESKPGKLVGVLIVEGLQSPLGKSELEPTWQLIQRSVVNAVANSRAHNGLFLMPLWRSLGKFTDLFRGHHRNKAIAATVAAIAVLAVLVFVPGDFKLRAEGVIQPAMRSKIYAEAGGVVEQLLVENGQAVEPGKTLLVLSDPKLDAEIAEVEGELLETREKLRTAKLQRIHGRFEDDEKRKEKVVASAGFAAKLDKLEEQHTLLLAKRSQLIVDSPIAGEAIVWDATRTLLARPVEAGQRLLTVINPDGPWELELKLQDKRTGYLRRFFHADARGSVGNQRPKVSYVLTSHPLEVHEGAVREVARRADVDEDEGNVVRVYVDVEQLNGVRPGTEVIAHIHVGKASIGYCKVFEFFDWVRRMRFKYG